MKSTFINSKKMKSIGAHCNLSAWETETGGQVVWSRLALGTVRQNKINNRRKEGKRRKRKRRRNGERRKRRKATCG